MQQFGREIRDWRLKLKKIERGEGQISASAPDLLGGGESSDGTNAPIRGAYDALAVIPAGPLGGVDGLTVARGAWGNALSARKP